GADRAGPEYRSCDDRRANRRRRFRRFRLSGDRSDGDGSRAARRPADRRPRLRRRRPYGCNNRNDPHQRAQGNITMIEIDHLTKRYNGKAAVDDVSLVIEAHSITAVVGTSGSGKTTLLRMINRLEEPTEGAVRIDGVDNRSVHGYELRRGIGYAIQGYGLFPHRTVAQNIATVPLLLGWEAGRIKARVEELLALFQLDPALYGPRYPHELSGGQQQRVGVARGLAAEPNILLMDEPFGALDAIIRTKAREDLQALQKQLGITIILVTHDIEEAIQLGDMIAVMDA